MAIYKNTPPIVTSGLILHLDAGSRMSYTSGSTTWSNLSGNTAISGALINSPTFDSANQGSIQTNGTNSWVNLGTATSLGWSSVLTVSFWYNWTAFSNGAHVLTMWDLVGGVNQRTIIHSVNATNQVQQAWSPDGTLDGTTITSPIACVVGRWYNFTSVFRSGVRELWQDSVLVGNLSQATINTTATTNRLGVSCIPARAGDTVAGYTNGKSSLVTLYNRALSSQEINQNYNATKARFGLI